MIRLRLWRTAFFLGALAGAAGLFSSDVWAANAGDGDKLRQEAENFERKGDWNLAGEIYLRMLAENRQSTTLRQKLLLCSRHIQLTNRHRDRFYLERVRDLTISQSLTAYLDALGKLQANYVDRDKITLGALFRAGLDEFGFALADAAFRREHLAEASDEAIQSFAQRAREEWAGANCRQPAQVRQVVREIAAAAQTTLGLKPSVAVMEFVCGACNALDEQTAYLPPSDEVASLTGQLTAVGVRLATSADGQHCVEQVEPNTWAARAGLKDGDRIVRLGRGDGEREDSGLLVEIEVVGRGDMSPRTLRLPAVLPSVVDLDLSAEGIGYVRLTGFLKNTPQDLYLALDGLKMRGLRALIVDLRGNPGGLFSSAIEVAERFIPDGIIVSTQGQAGPFNRTYASHSGAAALDVPLFVLVDGDTASAAELLAGALKENRRAILIGQPTYGKGTVQQVLQLAAGGGVRITLARFYPPDGRSIQGVGVVPQVAVPASQARDEAIAQARQLPMMMRP